MSLVVVGSIAFDAVQTPFGQRERMLGGSAVHFSLAASFFTDVRVVGPVGYDFGDEEYVGLDSMNLWIETARDSLLETIGGVDLVFLNDAEIRMLMREANLVRAARALIEHGPKTIVAKQGEYGAALFAGESFFALPAYPL